ncbi:MAG: hypothetical protein VX938_05550, partial [Myxococcota bacterium]|nr:hypothetical protein [Myxococcota bacterium]
MPTLLPLEPVTATVSETLHVSLPVDNPDRLSLSYSFAPSGALGSLNLYAVASVVGTETGGEFTWTPLASHVGTHQITFTVGSDSGTHSQTLLVTVNPAATAAPIFLSPGSGGTYDLATKSCIKVTVEVKDDDSSEVAIRSREPLPAGGTLTTTDPKRALPSRHKVSGVGVVGKARSAGHDVGIVGDVV